MCKNLANALISIFFNPGNIIVQVSDECLRSAPLKNTLRNLREINVSIQPEAPRGSWVGIRVLKARVAVTNHISLQVRPSEKTVAAVISLSLDSFPPGSG